MKAILFPYTEAECAITFNSADVATNNLLRIVLPRGKTQRISELDIMRLLARRLPAHIWYGLEVVYSESAPLFFGVCTTYISDISINAVEEDVTDIVYFGDELEEMLVDEFNAILSE